MRQTPNQRHSLWAPESPPARTLGPVVATASVIALVLVVLFVFYAFWGVRAIRQTLIRETERNGIALLESLILASQYSITAAVLTDRLGWENLAARAHLAAARLGADRSAANDLVMLAADAGADGVTLWRGNQPPRSYPADLDRAVRRDTTSYDREWDFAEMAVSPLEISDTVTGDHWLGAAVPTEHGGIAIWKKTTSNEKEPSWSGIGALIQEIGRRSEINYIMLQSPDGIVFASRPLPPVLRLADDDFLVRALDDTVAVSREIVFEGVKVLEVVEPFLSADFPSGVFRVGIRLDGVEAAQRRLVTQLGLSALLFVLLATAALAFLVARRSYGVLSRAYQRVETLTQRVLDSMDQAVIAADSQGRITVFNRAAERLFGRTIPSTDGLQTVDAVLGDDPYRLREVAGGGVSIHDAEHQLNTPDGPRQLVFSTTPVITGDRREGAVSVVRDETEAREMAAQIERTQRLTEMGTLAAGVAHEIRNPLNAIALAAQRLRMEIDNPDAAPLAEAVLNESRRLNKIVEDFLSLARASTQPTAVLDFSELVAAVGKMAALEAGQKGITWTQQVAEGQSVLGVGDELRKAVWNIMSNAIAATPAGGEVRVSLAQTDGRVRLDIIDSGCGITNGDLSRVFQPYFTTKEEGTGLGLAITHRIMTDHGGTIEIESPPSGADKGTRVTVELPAADTRGGENVPARE